MSHCKHCYEFHIIKELMEAESRRPFLAALGRYIVPAENGFPKWVVEHLETQVHEGLGPEFFEIESIYTIKVETLGNFFFRLSGLSRNYPDLADRMTEYDVFAQVELGGHTNDGERFWVEIWSIRK